MTEGIKVKGIKIDPLSKDEASQLVGGFSLSLSFEGDSIDSVNNCKGGNSKKGCGAKKKRKNKKQAKGTNTNCSGNCVSGCGG